MAKDGLDDYNRHKSDRLVNNQEVDFLDHLLDLAGDRGQAVAALGMKMVAIFGGKVDADTSDEVFPVVESRERSAWGS